VYRGDSARFPVGLSAVHRRAPVGWVSVKFAGGRMFEALNALIADGQFNEWKVGYPGHVVVEVRSHDLSVRTAMAPLNVPIPGR
jgi:hypothetical protein